MTAEGQSLCARAASRAAAQGTRDSGLYLDRSLYDRCLPGASGSMMPANYGNSYRIVQSPG